jgi:hypothetical protein
MRGMKKILLYGLLLFTAVACKKEKDITMERPDVRLNEKLEAYGKQLSGAEYGWIAYLFPDGGGAYTFSMKFDDKNRVTMFSDIDAATASTSYESSYRLKAAQLPSLYFDTYSYLHLLSDPDPNAFGGTLGKGYSSDFEFSILSSSTDTIKLKGNLNGSLMLLVRTKKDEKDNFITNALAINALLSKITQFSYYYNHLTVGSKQYDITINADQRTVSFYYGTATPYKRFTTDYAVSATGIFFKEPFIDGDLRIADFHNIQVDVAQKKVTLTTGTTTVSTVNTIVPYALDKNAPSTMYSNGQDGYLNNFGFTINGVSNAQNVTSIPGYLGMVYYPQFGSGYDGLIFYYNNTGYGPAFLTHLVSDGKVVFDTYVGNFGVSPGAPSTTVIANVRNQLLQSAGYYVFQTGKKSFDLVSIADSRIWIRFY